jgi:segregation and condensation protein B
MFEELPVLVEALVFASELPIRVEEIQQALDAHLYQAVPKKNILQALESLKTKYQSEGFSFELVAIAGGYQFLSKPIHAPLLGVWLRQRSHKKLTKAAMETLAVIAYQQPITKAELERVRGVNSDYAIQKLLEKELIEIRGRSTDIGRPLLYGTNPKFMQHFGIQSIKDLPKLKEFKPETNEIGDRT